MHSTPSARSWKKTELLANPPTSCISFSNFLLNSDSGYSKGTSIGTLSCTASCLGRISLGKRVVVYTWNFQRVHLFWSGHRLLSRLSCDMMCWSVESPPIALGWTLQLSTRTQWRQRKRNGAFIFQWVVVDTIALLCDADYQALKIAERPCHGATKKVFWVQVLSTPTNWYIGNNPRLPTFLHLDQGLLLFLLMIHYRYCHHSSIYQAMNKWVLFEVKSYYYYYDPYKQKWVEKW